MAQLLKVPESTLSKWKNISKSFVNKKGIYGSLQRKTKDKYVGEDGFEFTLSRPSKESVIVTEAFEKTLAVYYTIMEVLSEKERFNASVNSEREFLNLFAMYAGALSGLEEFALLPKKDSQNHVSEVHLQFRSQNFSETFIDTFSEGIKKSDISEGDKLAQVARGYLEKTIDTIIQKKDDYPDLVEKVTNINLQVNGLTLVGFGVREEKQTMFNIDFKDLVGVDEIVEDMKKIIGNLAEHYRSKDEWYGKKVPNLILFHGPPGTGKTSLVNAIGKYMNSFPEVPFIYREVSSALKSKWMGESSKNLRNTVYEVQKFSGMGLIFSDEADILFSQTLDGDSQAETRFMAEAMQMIDGIKKTIPNYIWIMCVNNKDRFYAPLHSRIQQQYNVLGPRTPEDHAKLIWMLTKDLIKDGLMRINQEQFKNIGDCCNKLGFRGRETAKLAKLIRRQTDIVTITSELQSRYSFPELKEYVKKNSRIVQYNDIIEFATEVGNGMKKEPDYDGGDNGIYSIDT